MRFLKDGPSIPDSLLEKCDSGEVVFLCGAGVSIPSGMPSYKDLTKHVIDTLEPPKDSKIMKAFKPWRICDTGPKIPLDEIFNLLHEKYDRTEVNRLVTERLTEAKKDTKAEHKHQIISRISSDGEGNPQIVTTNFDLLFEKKNILKYEPPAFPNISFDVPIASITYLHGRLDIKNEKGYPYILSSADFGRAYLSEGWATSFLRSLLKDFTVVMVGYKADDPPIKYLLQGLKGVNHTNQVNLYAFDRGSSEKIESEWEGKGVEVIAYSGEGNDHSHLWDTLEAWAERADNPKKWKKNVIKTASSCPRDLEAYERGQVAHLVRTKYGAKLLYKTESPINLEWLCVFDSRCRMAEPYNSYGMDIETFKPRDNYGLDDDPPQYSEKNSQTHSTADNLLLWRQEDTDDSNNHNLSIDIFEQGSEQLSSQRLWYLAQWIIKNMDNPLVVWWASKQNKIPSFIANRMRAELSWENISRESRKIWGVILDRKTKRNNDSLNYNNPFDLANRIQHEGWTSNVFQEYKIETEPTLIYGPPIGLGTSKPPSGTWDDTPIEDIIRIELMFPTHHIKEIDIPDKILLPIFDIAQQHMMRASILIPDVYNGDHYFRSTCYPSREVDGEEADLDIHKYFRWFLELFSRLISHNPRIARSYMEIWPFDEIFFRQLKLFAFNNANLFDATEVFKNLINLNQSLFWDYNVRRELLFLISDRWEEFNKNQKYKIIERVLSGPGKMSHMDDESYQKYRDESVALYARYLINQKHDISHKQKSRLDNIISKLPKWNDSQTSEFVVQHGIRTSWIRIDENPESLINLPDSKIVEKAESLWERPPLEFVERRPFTGLVKLEPKRALTALSISARQKHYPIGLWNALIDAWPEKTNNQLLLAFIKHLNQLPYEIIIQLRYNIGSWVDKRFVEIYELDSKLAWKFFDHLLSRLTSSDGEVTKNSTKGKIDNETTESSKRTYQYARNSPVGKLTHALLEALNSLKLKKNAGLPDEFITRIEKLLKIHGEGGDYAVSVLTFDVSWLHYIDSKWVINNIVPLFEFDHSRAEPAWSGLLYYGDIPVLAIWKKIMKIFAGIFSQIDKWGWDDESTRIATNWLVRWGVSRQSKTSDLNISEIKNCLRSMNEHNRVGVIFFLRKIGAENENGWRRYVIPFIKDIWPHEKEYKTGNSTGAWINLLRDTGKNFPSVLAVVQDLLSPISSNNSHYGLYGFSKNDDNQESLVVKFPESILSMLDILISDNPEEIFYELEEILKLIKETKPELIKDKKFRRLEELIDNQ